METNMQWLDRSWTQFRFSSFGSCPKYLTKLFYGKNSHKWKENQFNTMRRCLNKFKSISITRLETLKYIFRVEEIKIMYLFIMIMEFLCCSFKGRGAYKFLYFSSNFFFMNEKMFICSNKQVCYLSESFKKISFDIVDLIFS